MPCPTITQRYVQFKNVLLIFVAGHNYFGKVWTHYGLGRQAAVPGVMIVGSLVPLAHGTFWALQHDPRHPQGAMYTNVAPVLLLFHPTLILIVYRKIMSRFSKGHSVREGQPYLAWLFGGSDAAWARTQCFLMLMAALPCLAWSVPLAGLLATTSICMAIQHDLYRHARRLHDEALNDAMIEGKLMR